MFPLPGYSPGSVCSIVPQNCRSMLSRSCLRHSSQAQPMKSPINIMRSSLLCPKHIWHRPNVFGSCLVIPRRSFILDQLLLLGDRRLIEGQLERRGRKEVAHHVDHLRPRFRREQQAFLPLVVIVTEGIG